MLKFCAKIKELVNYEYLPLLNAPGVKFKVGHLPFVQICCLFGPTFFGKKVVFPLFFFKSRVFCFYTVSLLYHKYKSID